MSRPFLNHECLKKYSKFHMTCLARIKNNKYNMIVIFNIISF